MDSAFPSSSGFDSDGSDASREPRVHALEGDSQMNSAQYDSETRRAREARLLLHFGAPLVSTALGLALNALRMQSAAWCLFIISAAFLVAALRALFVFPGNAADRSLGRSSRKRIADLDRHAAP
jgi:hypothetical protein